MIGRIYKITSIKTDKIYIGSTTKSLTERLLKHEYNYKAFQNGKYRYNLTIISFAKLWQLFFV